MPLHHATLVVIRDRGVLIEGRSGSGKTTLAAALLQAAHRNNWFVRLVADDQVHLDAAVGGRSLLGSAPATIAGLWEVPPLGPKPTAHESRAVIDLVVSLVPPTDLPRLVEPRPATFSGVTVSAIQLPSRTADTTASAVSQLLFSGQIA